ncbi:Hypothetical protein, putative [Bodo saltans]|uniref:Uncharacterized protein n=1 Tax=Bodo saltans TaxID=75058 RepID=A0A0S4JCN0_BODSA|nr:Hypothetical protein, putative [Bodo saltans]|eukprot:CUG86060.1 Hypothetical protein, putative [Bodo saltans]
MASSEERAFVRVFLPGEQLRLFQLLPRVKFASITRALNMDGSLYLGERKIDGAETPDSLGLKHGLDHAIDVSFVPRPPQFLFRPQDEHTSGTYTPSLVFEEQNHEHHQRSFQRDETSVGSEASLPLSKDVQAVLRLLKDKHDRAKSPGSVDGRRAFQPTAFHDTSAAPAKQTSSNAVATPYNPRSNELRASNHSTDRQHGSPDRSQPLNKVNATTVDRPSRRALPLEHHQRDTSIPHTTWPLPSFVNSRHNDSAGPLDTSHTIEPSHTGAIKEPPSPRLQGTRAKRVVPQSEAPQPVVEVLLVPRPAAVVPEDAAVMSERSISEERQQPVHAEFVQQRRVDHDDEFKRELNRLSAELEEEKRVRRQLEKQVEWLTALLPDDLVTYSAQHEHQRLMEDLRRERAAKRRQPSAIVELAS